jgi:hypothetical protein
MIRSFAFTALITAGLLGAAAPGVAQAAEPGQVLVNRTPDQTRVYGGSSNVVGGMQRNEDGSRSYLSQPGRARNAINPTDVLNNNLHQSW